MSASLGLYRLQQVDRQIDRTRYRLEVIRKTLENDTELKHAQTHFETVNDENVRDLRGLITAENDVKNLKLKIEQTEASLYGGNVRNPKELQDLQKDVASLKKHLTTLEDRELEALQKSEDSTATLDQARATLEGITSRLGGEHKVLLDEQMELVKQLESLGQEREASVTPIEVGLLATYEDLRKQKRGVAVSEVQDGACAACGTDLNASMQQNARSQKQLAYCPSCGRILFAN